MTTPKIRRSLPVTAVLTAIALSACAPAAQRYYVKQGDTPLLKEQIAKLAQARMREYDVTGMSVALVDGSDIVLEAGYGMADKAASRPATPQTLYQIGSITKLFTATALMQLAEQGKLKLDAPLTSALPEFSIRSRFPQATPITLRQVLTHHAGLPGNHLKGMFTAKPDHFSTLIPLMKDESIASPPGSVYSYSNVGFTLLGSVVERVSRERYEDYLSRRILRPLGMTTSSFTPEDPTLVTKAYNNGRLEAEPALRDLPAGGLMSSVHEMTRFMRMAMEEGSVDGQRILTRASMQEMMRPQNQADPLAFGFHNGLAWILSYPSLSYAGPVAWHNGSTIHSHSAMLLLPAQRLGIIVLTNSTGGRAAAMQVAEEGLKLAVQAKTGLLPPDEPTPKDTPREDLKAYVGRYATPMGSMRFHGDRLDMMGTTFHLVPRDKDTYGVRLKLFGLIPLDLPQLRDLTLRFTTLNDKRLMVVAEKGLPAFMGQRWDPVPATGAWKARLGRYDVENLGDDFRMSKDIELVEDDGQLSVRARSALMEMPAVSQAIQPLSDEEAVVVGVGQGTGDVIRVVQTPQGERILFSGYRYFRKAP